MKNCRLTVFAITGSSYQISQILNIPTNIFDDYRHLEAISTLSLCSMIINYPYNAFTPPWFLMQVTRYFCYQYLSN